MKSSAAVMFQTTSGFVGDFYTGLFPNGTVRYSTGEQYEGVYVEMTNLIECALILHYEHSVSLTQAIVFRL